MYYSIKKDKGLTLDDLRNVVAECAKLPATTPIYLYKDYDKNSIIRNIIADDEGVNFYNY